MSNLNFSFTAQLDKAAFPRACHTHHCDENDLVVRLLDLSTMALVI
jgi:hypothetical protein